MGAPFEVIDHTADIGIITRGKDLSELFANAAAGMIHLMADASGVRPAIQRQVSLEAGDPETLLVAWLNELLYLLDTERLLLTKFDLVIADNKLVATCYGDKFDMKKTRLKREIKAATYHDLRIVKDGGIYSARIIFDI